MSKIKQLLNESPIARKEKLIKEIENLDSKWLKKQTGLSSSKDIDKARDAFLDFTSNNDILFKDLMDAWKEFANDYEFKIGNSGKVEDSVEFKKKVLA